jgi:hypothetical protein
MNTDYAKAIAKPSPNFWPGRQGHQVAFIVMHGTASPMPGALNFLTSAASDASVHYMVAQDGTVYQLVSESDSAWGNGTPEDGSPFLGGDNPNLFTISIEHERDDSANTQPISAAQQAASTALVADIRTRHNVPLIPHSLISPQSRARCPGAGFPMTAIDIATRPPSAITFVAFTATPQTVPISFYEEPSTQSKLLYQSKAALSTELNFDAWQYGESLTDPSTGEPDRRWYRRAAPSVQGWAASAWVIGNAPGSPP